LLYDSWLIYERQTHGWWKIRVRNQDMVDIWTDR
jgi:hypothetical protein